MIPIAQFELAEQPDARGITLGGFLVRPDANLHPPATELRPATMQGFCDLFEAQRAAEREAERADEQRQRDGPRLLAERTRVEALERAAGMVAWLRAASSDFLKDLGDMLSPGPEREALARIVEVADGYLNPEASSSLSDALRHKLNRESQ